MAEIYDISFDEVDVIKELWEKNRQFHENTSEHFSGLYRFIDFDMRIKGFGVFNRDRLKITVARDNEKIVGYCFSTAMDGKGELESIYVEEAYRGSGVGAELADRHLQWMKEKNCRTIGVTVSQENAASIGFYKKLGFYPNTLYMQQLQIE